MRQEQERASEEVSEVAPGVLRLQLPIRMPGLGHVNCYALVDGEGVALVDPGLPTAGSYRALKARLARAGFAVRHVHTVIVTHSHPDHFGGAARLVRESGARLVAHRRFHLGPSTAQPEVSVDDLHAHECSQGHGVAEPAEPAAPQPARSRLRPWSGLTPWGGAQPLPSFRLRLLWYAMRLFGRSSFPVVSDPVEEGAVLRLAGREWYVVYTPGHTEDHICLHDPADGIFLAGDHVLPTITPHISGMTGNRDPLAAFFESLDRAAAMPHVQRALPAHGHPFDDLAGRCAAIKVHHHERLAKLHAIARELGPATVRDFSRHLFKRRSWGAMAESETYAHLEHIRLAGEAERRLAPDGKVVYVL